MLRFTDTSASATRNLCREKGRNFRRSRNVLFYGVSRKIIGGIGAKHSGKFCIFNFRLVCGILLGVFSFERIRTEIHGRFSAYHSCFSRSVSFHDWLFLTSFLASRKCKAIVMRWRAIVAFTLEHLLLTGYSLVMD